MLFSFGQLLFTALAQIIEVCGHLFVPSSLKVPPQHFSQTEVCSSLILFFFSHSVGDLRLCFGLITCCMTQFESSFHTWHYTVEYRGSLSDCKLSRSCGSKQAQFISPPPPWLTLTWGVCADVPCLVFPHFVCLRWHWSRKLLFRCIFACKPKPCCNLLLERRAFLLATPENKPYFFSPFLIAHFMNFNI